MKAADYLRQAAEVIEQRGQLRDKPDGERSMERAVDAYITLNGPQMQTELDGWIFMSILKLARATAGKPHIDDWTDLAGYAALAAECVEKNCKTAPSSGDVFKDLNLAEYTPEKTVFYGENANGPTCQPIGILLNDGLVRVPLVGCRAEKCQFPDCMTDAGCRNHYE